MDQDPSAPGKELNEGYPQSSEQLRKEIEQTRAELGDTVAELAAKTDVKAQVQGEVSDARESVRVKVSELTDAAGTKKDEFVASAQGATPESAQAAGRRALALAQQNQTALVVAGAFALGILLGRRRA